MQLIVPVVRLKDLVLWLRGPGAHSLTMGGEDDVVSADCPAWRRPLMPNERFQVLGAEECMSLLEHRHLGRVAFFSDGLPSILPINYVLVDGLVVFRTDEGSKLEAAMRGEPVAFEIDGFEVESRVGWSVLVRGHAQRVSDPSELARLRTMPLVPWAPGAKPHYVRVSDAEITGRRISAADLPSRWWG
jgi:nitroimidazol reductase NimA-like FMN-containing flavoprotein (pyridoxamine 5'-phosphate oxidase superfamily)